LAKCQELIMGLSEALGAVVILLAGMALGWLWTKTRKSPAKATPQLVSQLTELRAIGELSVFKAASKDILTHVDHSFGEFGRKYLSWAFSKKKLAMVFEFEMDFRYDLRSEQLQILSERSVLDGATVAHITLPPCKIEVSIKNLAFYDEQRAKFLPWLLPDLLQGFFDGRLSEEDKNQLIASAKAHATQQALMLGERFRPAVERSATLTLQALARGAGATRLEVGFSAGPGAPVIEEASVGALLKGQGA
jgi:Protein of unknown function (DUF4230)